MGVVTIEQALTATNQPGRRLSTFTIQTMAMVRTQASYAARQKVHYSRPGLLNRLSRLSAIGLAAVIIAIVALASGTVYAVFQWWSRPEVRVNSVDQNQYGRLEAIIDPKHCADFNASVPTFEVKKGHDVSADELAKIIEARCERNQIERWGFEKWRSAAHYTNNSVPMRVKTVSAAQLTAVLPGGGDHTTRLQPETLFISNGVTASASDIRPGDAVQYIERVTYKDGNLNNGVAFEIVAVIRLNLPLEYYTDKQALLTLRDQCPGNPAETCVNAPALQIRGSSVSPIPADTAMAVIQGRLVSHNQSILEIEASSGTIYKIGTLSDIITEYNVSAAKDTGIRANIGDILTITYFQRETDNPKQSAAELLSDVMLVVEFETKDGPFKKY